GTVPGSIPGGMPIFHVASEWQEISNWGNTWELGDAPQRRALRAGGADRLLSTFVQPGTGHYEYDETQSGPIATFIRQIAQARIPANWSATAVPTLNAINPTTLASLASQTNGTGYVSLSATLQSDGVTFKVQAAAMNQSPVSRLFNGAPVGLASGPIYFKANGSGGMKQTGADTFRVWMDRG